MADIAHALADQFERRQVFAEYDELVIALRDQLCQCVELAVRLDRVRVIGQAPCMTALVGRDLFAIRKSPQ